MYLKTALNFAEILKFDFGNSKCSNELRIYYFTMKTMFQIKTNFIKKEI